MMGETQKVAVLSAFEANLLVCSHSKNRRKKIINDIDQTYPNVACILNES